MSEPELRPFPTEWERGLVVVAHPDDIEWSAAAAVCAWSDAGKDVRYLLVTRGEAGIAGLPPAESGPLREAEQRRAGEIVGAREVLFLDHRDGRIEAGVALRRDIARVIRRVRPEVVVTLNHLERWGLAPGAGWNSADHRAVGQATLDAVSDAANEWIFPELDAEGLAPWQGTRWTAIGGSPWPTHAVDVSACVDRAFDSLRAHRRYIEALVTDGGDPDDYARRVVDRALGMTSGRFGGRPTIAFELIGG
jgi:LmbE family N-acetylglucosaminyl deacetylase